MVGDASDNVKGIKGIGPKSAAKLLGIFGNLDSILQDAPTSSLISTGIRNKLLAADRQQIALSRRLVALDTQIPIPNLYTYPQSSSAPWDEVLEFADRNSLSAFKTRVIREKNRHVSSPQADEEDGTLGKKYDY